MSSSDDRTADRQITIRDEEEEHAYVVDVDGRRAGKAIYHIRGGRHFFVHTEIDPEFSGMGLGTKLVEYALDDARSKNGVVVPICPFFRAFLKRHQEYQDLVDQEILARIERADEEKSE